MIAEIAPATKTTGDREIFSYLIPPEMETEVKIGSIVRIPFGRRHILGVIIKLSDSTSPLALKNISSIVQDFSIPKSYVETALWISDYYLCSLGEAIELFLPTLMKRPRKDQQKPQNEEILLNRLTKSQKDIFESLKTKLINPQKPALLFGVTGSGKTEIYLHLAKEAIRQGKQVIVLVPEIILTPQTVEKFESVFKDEVCLMHSHLSKSEKLKCYSDFRLGAKKIIIGPRSALLVPHEKIGLIIIDEEQEDSYKQEQSPRYHAVDLARHIAEKNNALLLLGSATPRVETFYQAKSGKYDLFTLEKRFGKEQLPIAEIVDLRIEMRSGNYSPISLALQSKIAEVLATKRQILLFLNRRGSATFVSCRDCGHVMLCKNCAIPLVYHLNSSENLLSCHHCDYKEQTPAICPKCSSNKIKYFGAGVEKIEREIRELFPNARTRKIDSTTIKSKHDYDIFYQEFKSGQIDIVIGTQMIAKGLDIPGVDLVGIISADTGLHLPQYRASERVFQILTQVSGRSGRKHSIGRTVIQTYWPESPAVLAAHDHNYEEFYNREIEARRTFKYPPFTHLVNVIAENKDEDSAVKTVNDIIKDISNFDFIGPGSCFYRRLHSKYRKHIVIKIDKLPSLELKKLAALHPHLILDVDPVNLL